MKDIDKFKQLLQNLSVKYREYFRDEETFNEISYPIYDVKVLSVKSNLLENDGAYGVGLEIVFDKNGKFIGFEPYGDQ